MVKKTLLLSILMITLCCLELSSEGTAKRTIVVTAERTKFIDKAKQLIGSPYVYGAVGPDSFDCSGLIYYAARESIQFQLPRTARAIYNYCRNVEENDREPGDLLFFKTTGNNYVSHVGIYIGNKQFISAISDGPNTGVIVSSLNQDYWKTRYFSTGRFLETAKERDEKNATEIAKKDPKENPDEKKALEKKPEPKESASKEPEKPKKTEDEKINATPKPVTKPDVPLDPSATIKAEGQKKNNEDKSNQAENNKENGESKENEIEKIAGIVFDVSLCGDWSFFDYEKIGFNFRGIDVDLVVSNYDWILRPGAGIFFRANTANKLFQMPVVLTATINDYIRLYGGPVIAFTYGTLADKKIQSSVYPGIAGVIFSTPAIKAGKTKIQFTQDISYTFYNEIDGSALSFKESFGNGFAFYTGIKVTLPNFIKSFARVDL